MNPYETLGIKPQATQDEIKNAYRSLAKKFHPDLNPGNKQAETRFKEINSAYEMIGTPEARKKFEADEAEATRARQYGRENPYYHQTQSGPGGSQGRYSQSFDGMDEDLFSSLFGGRRRAGPPPPADELYQMSVDFKDSILGTEKEITLPQGKRLRVKIPAGIESGKKLRFAGQAGSAAPGSPAGDVYVQIQVNDSNIYTRVGNNIEIELPISVSEALLGGEIKVPTLDGSVMMKIPPLVSSGQKLRIAGKGVPEKGDQIVKLKIMSPPAKSGALDPEFKAAVEAWSARHPFNPRSEGVAS